MNSDIPAAPRHARMDQFPVHDNCLWVGGQPVTALAAELGTPFYAYDGDVMAARVAQLRAALPPELHLHYAVKANPMPALVRHMAGLTNGLDVASAGELEVALATGVDARSISFAGPGKSPRDLALAASSGVIINLESEDEMRRLATLATRADAGNRRPRVAIRVNPDFELKSAGMKMGSGAKPFGVDAERVPQMLAELARLPLDFVGFHIFCGSQNLRPEAIVAAQTQTFELAFELAAHAAAPVRWLNIGGGLGVPYFPGEQDLDLSPISAGLGALLPRARRQLPDAEIVMELGRYLVAGAGVYVCEVIERKVSRGETFLITNGGLHHHLAASGNFGQVIRKNYPLALGNRIHAKEEERETVHVVGPLCTPLDLLGHRVSLPRAQPGDLVVVYQSGAYGYSASPRDFLSHPEPAQAMLLAADSRRTETG